MQWYYPAWTKLLFDNIMSLFIGCLGHVYLRLIPLPVQWLVLALALFLFPSVFQLEFPKWIWTLRTWSLTSSILPSSTEWIHHRMHLPHKLRYPMYKKCSAGDFWRRMDPFSWFLGATAYLCWQYIFWKGHLLNSPQCCN